MARGGGGDARGWDGGDGGGDVPWERTRGAVRVKADDEMAKLDAFAGLPGQRDDLVDRHRSAQNLWRREDGFIDVAKMNARREGSGNGAVEDGNDTRQ